MTQMTQMTQMALDIGLVSSPSFANFFAGPNQAVVAHLALWAGTASQAPARSPVPTYLWGEAASGKTHLLRAVAEVLHSQGASVGWMDATRLAPPEFDESWTAVLLDDCHLYDGAQQQAAFNWFVNAVASPDGHPRWVLAAGASPPADLALREDLRTRLGWGHIFELHMLTDKERQAVLHQEAVARGVQLTGEAADFMLNRFSRDLSSLMQLLDKLDVYALQTQRAITIPLIKAMLESE